MTFLSFLFIVRNRFPNVSLVLLRPLRSSRKSCPLRFSANRYALRTSIIVIVSIANQLNVLVTFRVHIALRVIVVLSEHVFVSVFCCFCLFSKLS